MHGYVNIIGTPRCQSPQVKLVAYESADPNFVFVGVPNEKGRYIRAERCVVEVCCPICMAAIGEPCISGFGNYWVATHWRRQKDAAEIRAERRRIAMETPSVRIRVSDLSEGSGESK